MVQRLLHTTRVPSRTVRKLLVRVPYVLLTTLIAALLPFFGAFIGEHEPCTDGVCPPTALMVLVRCG